MPHLSHMNDDHIINLINKTYYYMKEISITLEVLKNSYLIAHINACLMKLEHLFDEELVY